MIAYDGKKKLIGCVFAKGEHNYYNDSDFYAEYLDIEKGTIGYEEYDTTRFAGGGVATVDLTFDKLNEWWSGKGKSVHIEMFKKQLLREAEEVTRGKLVVVNRGRKVPHGVSGEVFWLKDVNYDPYRRDWGWETKIGIKDAEGNVYWTYAKNVDVISPENYIAEDELDKRLKRQYDALFNIALDLRENEDKAALKEEYYSF